MLVVFDLLTDTETQSLATSIDELVVAGWAGRDQDAIEHHVAELAAIGVPRPSRVPLYYRIAENQLTQNGSIQVVGPDSSGEVEGFVFSAQGQLYVSLASDHTDRQLETYGVAQSKQVCPKPLARMAWRYADVAGHWDDLVMRAWIEEDGERVLYQEGTLATLRTPLDLISGYTAGMDRLPDCTGMTCGTVGVIGGIRSASTFEMELFDPRRKRSIRHRYVVQALPVIA